MLATALIAIIAFALLTGSMLGVVIGATGLAVLHFAFGGNLSVLGNATWNVFNSFTFTAGLGAAASTASSCSPSSTTSTWPSRSSAPR